MNEPCEICGLDEGQDHSPCFEVKELTIRLNEARDEIALLVETAKEVVRISDRKHDAWDKLKAAIKAVEVK